MTNVEWNIILRIVKRKENSEVISNSKNQKENNTISTIKMTRQNGENKKKLFKSKHIIKVIKQ